MLMGSGHFASWTIKLNSFYNIKEIFYTIPTHLNSIIFNSCPSQDITIHYTFIDSRVSLDITKVASMKKKQDF